MPKFIGRQPELDRLINLQQKKAASFIIIKGRRRIGKSRLIEEFSKSFNHYYHFAGIPPEEKTTKQDQLDEFARQITRQFKTAKVRFDDWSDALWSIGERVRSGKILLFFDEISWMGSKDHTFLGKIKNFWDQQLKKNDQLMFVICGSASAWIEENILSHTGFVGRISDTITLDELPLLDCSKFWPKSISAYEKFSILSIIGGIPKYLEEIDPKQPAQTNIKKLCFTKGGFLVEEFEQIFSDLFLRKSAFYKQIVIALATGPKEQAEIAKALAPQQHGRLSEYLWELTEAGFIVRDYTWNIKTGKDASLSRYRLRDNYLRFYLKYIEPNVTKINRSSFALKSLGALPEWSSIIGLQFENLVINNKQALHRLLNIPPEDIICENPFFQRKTNRTKGCQIDYMIQTKFNNLYVCEIKFSKQPLDSSVVAEVEYKIASLHRPKNFSCRPVLIHVNGVSDAVIDNDYFAAIIDFSQLLTTSIAR